MTDDQNIQQDENQFQEVKAAPPVEPLKVDYEEKWKRALADYDNLKKETAKEKSEMAQFARGMAALDFVDIYDNIKKALAMALPLPEGENQRGWENWKQGIEHIKSQFAGALKDLGVEEIKTVGEKFDPNLHEAAGEEATPSSDGVSTSFRQPGIIIREITGGYKMGDKVVKAAKVIISK